MLLTILSSSHAPAIQGCLLAPAVIDVGAAPCPEPWSMKTTTMTPQPPSTPPSPALSSAMGQSSTSSETEPSSSSLTLLKAHGSSSSRLAPPPSCWATSCGRCAPPPPLEGAVCLWPSITKHPAPQPSLFLRDLLLAFISYFRVLACFLSLADAVLLASFRGSASQVDEMGAESCR